MTDNPTTPSGSADRMRDAWDAAISRVRRMVMDESSLESKLYAAIAYGLLRRLNYDGTYSDDPLEEILASEVRAQSSPSRDPGRTAGFDVLHVLSESYVYGGHSRLMVEWLRQRQRHEDQRVAITWRANPFLGKTLGEMGIELASFEGSLVSRARELLVLGRQARRIVLHIHPEDIVGAVVSRLLAAEGKTVLFLNHSDHQFSFGSGAAGAVLEISGYGWALTRDARAARAQHFLGIPMLGLAAGGNGVAASVPRPAQLQGPILSIGNAGKYKPAGGYDFPAFVDRLLSRVPNDVVIVGPTGNEPWWSSISPARRERVRFTGILPPERVSDLYRRAAAYVDSFPMIGGTVFQEALMAGVPGFGMATPFWGYSPIDRIRHDSVESLIEALAGYLSSGREESSQDEAREAIVALLGEERFNRSVEAAYAGNWQHPPPDFLVRPTPHRHFENAWRSEGKMNIAVPRGLGGGAGLRLRLAGRTLLSRHARLQMGRRQFVSWLFTAAY